MRLSPKQRAAMQGTRMRELRAAGYTSDVFAAKYGGTCAQSGLRYGIGEPVCFFEGFTKPILATMAAKIVDERRQAAAPKCSCGKVAEYDDACLRCGFVCENWFDESPGAVTRETPLALEVTA